MHVTDLISVLQFSLDTGKRGEREKVLRAVKAHDTLFHSLLKVVVQGQLVKRVELIYNKIKKCRKEI